MLRMSSSTQHSPGPTRIPAITALRWWLDGLALLRRTPLRLALLGWTPLLAELLIQQIPLAGVPLSKLLTPLIGVGALYATARLAQGQRPACSDLLCGLRPPLLGRMLITSALLMPVFLFQLATAYLCFGYDAVAMVLLNTPQPELMTLGFVLTLILPGVLFIATPLMLTIPRVLFHGDQPLAAVVFSLRTAIAQPAAFALTGLITCGLLVVGLMTGPGLLLLVPWFLTTGYLSYRALNETTTASCARSQALAGPAAA